MGDTAAETGDCGAASRSPHVSIEVVSRQRREALDVLHGDRAFARLERVAQRQFSEGDAEGMPARNGVSCCPRTQRPPAAVMVSGEPCTRAALHVVKHAADAAHFPRRRRRGPGRHGSMGPAARRGPVDSPAQACVHDQDAAVDRAPGPGRCGRPGHHRRRITEAARLPPPRRASAMASAVSQVGHDRRHGAERPRPRGWHAPCRDGGTGAATAARRRRGRHRRRSPRNHPGCPPPIRLRGAIQRPGTARRCAVPGSPRGPCARPRRGDPRP